MSDLHVRHCECEECLPGHKAVATRVHRTRRPKWATNRTDAEKFVLAGRAVGRLNLNRTTQKPVPAMAANRVRTPGSAA